MHVSLPLALLLVVIMEKATPCEKAMPTLRAKSTARPPSSPRMLDQDRPRPSSSKPPSKKKKVEQEDNKMERPPPPTPWGSRVPSPCPSRAPSEKNKVEQEEDKKTKQKEDTEKSGVKASVCLDSDTPDDEEQNEKDMAVDHRQKEGDEKKMEKVQVEQQKDKDPAEALQKREAQANRADTGTCVQRVTEKIMVYMGIPLPWHPDQPHLAEWQAFSAQEILFNLDNTVDGRNEAQKQAVVHRRQMTTDADQAEDSSTTGPKIIVEELGGAPADDDGGDFEDEPGGTKHELQLSSAMITRVLSRAEERDRAGQVGRPKDMHAEMQRVAAIFGTELDNATKAFDAQEQPDKAIGGGARSSHRQHR